MMKFSLELQLQQQQQQTRRGDSSVQRVCVCEGVCVCVMMMSCCRGIDFTAGSVCDEFVSAQDNAHSSPISITAR